MLLCTQDTSTELTMHRHGTHGAPLTKLIDLCGVHLNKYTCVELTVHLCGIHGTPL